MSHAKRVLEKWVHTPGQCTPMEVAFARGYCFKDWPDVRPCDCERCSGGLLGQKPQAEDSSPGAQPAIDTRQQIQAEQINLSPARIVDLKLGDHIVIEGVSGQIRSVSFVGNLLQVHCVFTRPRP
jgi:hypothetical protein